MSADGITSYMKKQAGPSARELADMETFNAFIQNEEPSIIGTHSFQTVLYFKPPCLQGSLLRMLVKSRRTLLPLLTG